MSFAILYRNPEGHCRALARILTLRAYRSAAVYEFSSRDEAIAWAESQLHKDTDWQLVELDEL